MELQELSDRYEIAALLTGYTRAVDTSAWDDLDALFADDAVLDYESTGGPIGPLSVAKPFIRNLEGFTRWQHMLGQVAVRYAGDTASATTYMYNPMVATHPDGTEQLLECGGYYHFDAVRTPDGWRLTKLVDEIVWARGF